MDFDPIFLKKDPPIDESYAYLLKLLIKNKIPTVNNASGVFSMGTKSYLVNFPELTPKTFYSTTVGNTLKYIKKFGNTMIKQSDSSGGKGVKHIRYDSGKYLRKSLDKTILVVEYLLSAPKRGDKRVVILNGKILGSYIRLPDALSGVCDSSDNGAKLCIPTKADHEIVKSLEPHFEAHGIGLAALDLLIGKDGIEYLSEINVFNPGFFNLDVMHPELNIEKRVVDMLCENIK